MTLIEEDALSIDAAREEAAPLISEMAGEVSLDRFGAQGRGFLIYPMEPERYAHRIRGGHGIFLLRAGGETVGFIAGVGSDIIEREVRQAQHYNNMYALVTAWAHHHRIQRYFFLDQMVIRPERQNEGLGARLFTLFRRWLRGAVFIDVLEEPVENPRLKWWKAQGFERVTEIREVGREGLFDSEPLCWGIYVLPRIDRCGLVS